MAASIPPIPTPAHPLVRDGGIVTTPWFAFLRRVAQVVLYIRVGNGTPEGAIAAPVGTLFLRLDGSTNTTLYVKETGAGTSTGWAAK